MAPEPCDNFQEKSDDENSPDFWRCGNCGFGYGSHRPENRPSRAGFRK